MTLHDIEYLAPSPGQIPVDRGYYVTRRQDGKLLHGPYRTSRQAEEALAALTRERRAGA